MKNKTWRNILKVGLLIGISLFASVFICEIGLRILNISYPVFHNYDPVRGRVLEPGKEGWFRGEGEAYVKINQAGFRDVEHPLQKPNNTYRILILGDSYTEARQVALEDTYARKIEQRLQACERLSPRTIEVINFGVPGYGNAEQLVTLRSLGWPYDPDLVMTMFFSGNDLLDNFPRAETSGSGSFIPRPYFYFQDGELVLDSSFHDFTPTLLKYRVFLWGVHHFRTLEVINRAVQVMNAKWIETDNKRAFRETGLSEFGYAPPQTSLHREAWALTEGILTLMHKEVIEHGAKFFLVSATSPNQLDPEQQELVKARLGVDTLDYPEQRLQQLGKTVGFPVFNLLYGFQQYMEQRDVYLHGFPNTRLGAGHWNEKGHDLAAKLIAERLCSDDSIL